MKGAIISLGSKSSVMVGEAMKKYFDEVAMVDLKEIEVHLGKESGIFFQGNALEKYDCIYLKGSFRYANLLRSIAMMLAGHVPYMPLPAMAFTVVHNKLLTHLALQQKAIPMPRTYITSTVDSAKALLKNVRYPVVMKFPEGTQGKGVMFADSMSSAWSLLDALGALNQPFLIQEYVETGGTDIRALVVGDKVVAAMRRHAQKEEKRANIHAGGYGEPVELKREVAKLAIDTAHCLQVDICGVDILEAPRGPLVIEANISPGLQGLRQVSPVDIADEIALFMHKRTQEALDGSKKKQAEEIMQRAGEEIPRERKMEQVIVTKLQFRGEKVLLPEFVSRLSEFDDQKEYAVRARKGKVEIEEMDVG